MRIAARHICALAFAFAGVPGWSQPGALLGSKEATELFRRTVQLMESTAIAIPEMVRAGAPVVENAHQAQVNLEQIPGHSALTLTFLTNAKAYLQLTDALPKPFPFPEEGRRQLLELREAVARLESHLRALLEQKEEQIRSGDRDNTRRYREANLKLGPPAPGRPRVVFLGDSITDAWRLNEYFADRDFVNRGISGQITSQMLARMKQDVIDLKPAAVLVLAGTNDIARSVPPAVIQNNLAMIADLADHHKIKPLFASVLPVSDYHKARNPRYEQSRVRPPAAIRELNDWLMRFCKQRNYVYVDYFSKLADGKGSLPAEMADDGLHPNGAGYRIMAPIAAQAVEKALPAAPPQPPPKKRRLPF